MTRLRLTVIRKGATVLQLLSRKDKTLLVRRNALLVLDLALHVVNGVRGLDFKSDGLAREATVGQQGSARCIEKKLTSSRRSACHLGDEEQGEE